MYDLLVDGRLAGRAGVTGGNTLIIDMTTGTAETRPGPVGTLRFAGLPDGVKNVEIWLPHNETTELVALRTDAPVESAPDRDHPVWLHHGSSISQGSDAAGPTATWPALAAALGRVELIDLGLGGSALLDPFTARVLRDTHADHRETGTHRVSGPERPCRTRGAGVPSARCGRERPRPRR